jgi:hypothetical protein
VRSLPLVFLFLPEDEIDRQTWPPKSPVPGEFNGLVIFLGFVYLVQKEKKWT